LLTSTLCLQDTNSSRKRRPKLRARVISQTIHLSPPLQWRPQGAGYSSECPCQTPTLPAPDSQPSNPSWLGLCWSLTAVPLGATLQSRASASQDYRVVGKQWEKAQVVPILSPQLVGTVVYVDLCSYLLGTSQKEHSRPQSQLVRDGVLTLPPA
jgi:hypothetical protein